MPILEFACKSCGHQFEFLKLPSTEAAPRCPACGGEELERQLSGFAMGSRELTEARVKAARKQRLESKDYRDKKISETKESEHHHH